MSHFSEEKLTAQEKAAKELAWQRHVEEARHQLAQEKGKSQHFKNKGSDTKGSLLVWRVFLALFAASLIFTMLVLTWMQMTGSFGK